MSTSRFAWRYFHFGMAFALLPAAKRARLSRLLAAKVEQVRRGGVDFGYETGALVAYKRVPMYQCMRTERDVIHTRRVYARTVC